MSTKTTFKRVALVAVAALGLGVLSVAPSSAAAISVTVTPSATTSTIKTGETATISLTVSGILGGAGESLTVVGVRTKGASGTVNFNGTTDSTTTQLRAGSSTGAGAVLASGAYSADGIALDTKTVSASGTPVRAVVQANFVAPSTKGTYEVTIYSAAKDGSVGTTDIKPFVWTITVTADSTNADGSTTSFIAAAPVTATPTADGVVTASDALTTPAASILVTQKNPTSSANEPLIVTVTGPGYVAAGTDTSTANGKLRTLTTTGASQNWINVYADGTPGASTITITGSVTGIVLATEKLTFSDVLPVSISVTVKKAYVAAGANTTKVFAVTLKDSAGYAITGSAASVAGARTDTTTAGKAVASAASACSWSATDAVYYCDATGASTLVFGPAGYIFTATGTDANASTVSAAAVTTTFADTVATKVTISAPATANVGDKITYTLTATEKNGYPIADNSYEGGTANGSLGAFWNTTTVPTYSSSVTAFNSGETITTVSGVATKSVYVPSIAGSITNVWTLGGKSTAQVGAIALGIAGTTITTTTVVTNPGVDAATDAANEATDAANAATDAALAAADAADAATAAAQDASDAVAALSASVEKLVASLKAQLTSLTNLVIKIQKKVKA
jgi:trimeric autotransporter adhesin